MTEAQKRRAARDLAQMVADWDPPAPAPEPTTKPTPKPPPHRPVGFGTPSNLTKCPDCGSVISALATACPACGRPMVTMKDVEKAKRAAWQEAAGIILIFIGLGLAAPGVGALLLGEMWAKEMPAFLVHPIPMIGGIFLFLVAFFKTLR